MRTDQVSDLTLPQFIINEEGIFESKKQYE